MKQLPRLVRWEQMIYLGVRHARDRVLSPLVHVLVGLRVPPAIITILGIIFMMGFAFFLPTRPYLALIYALLSLAADAVDGAVARQRRSASDQGKFIDITADSFSFTLFLVGLLRAQWIEPTTGLLYAYFMLLSKVLHITWRNFAGFWSSDWHFRAVAGYVAGGCYILLGLATVAQIVWAVHVVNIVATVTLGILIIDSAVVATALARKLPIRK